VQADGLAHLPHLRDGQVGPAVPEAGLDVVALRQAGELGGGPVMDARRCRLRRTRVPSSRAVFGLIACVMAAERAG
jgi:hypothetical protein